MSLFKSFIWFVLVCFACNGLAASEDIVAFWEYNVFYLNETQSPRLKINARLKNVRGTRAVFLLPSYALSNECMIKTGTEIKVANGLKTEFIKDKCLLEVDHEDGSDINFEYYITTQMAEIFPHPTPFGLVVTDKYFYFCGRNLFLGLDEKNINMIAHINWHLPSRSSKIINSYGFSKEQKITSSQLDFLSSGFVGGEVFKKKIAQGLYIVTGDLKKIKRNEISKFIKGKVISLRKFWQEKPHSQNYIVSIFEREEEKSMSDGFVGVALNKFVGMFCYNIKDGLNNVALAMSTTHELVHRWIGSMGIMMVDDNMIEQTWFDEGFTDYYATRLNLQHEKMFSEYIDYINKILLYQSTKTISDDMMVQHMSYYHLGQFLAHNLNYHIKLHSNNLYSLDNVMLDLYELRKKSGNNKITVNDFKKIGNKYWSEFESYVNDKLSTNTFSCDDAQFGPCVKMTMKDYKKADYGLDYVESLTYNIVSGVKKGSKLYKAGIRNGQKIISDDGVIDKDSPSVPIRVTIETPNGNKTIVLEREGELISTPVYVLDKALYATNPKMCLKYLELGSN